MIKAAQEARKRAREREKIIKDGAIAEQRVIQAIMTHEDCLQKITDEGKTSCETFRNAATKATAMHAFDGVAALLRHARILTCQVCEAVVLWRKALDKIDALDATNKGYVGDAATLLTPQHASHSKSPSPNKRTACSKQLSATPLGWTKPLWASTDQR